MLKAARSQQMQQKEHYLAVEAQRERAEFEKVRTYHSNWVCLHHGYSTHKQTLLVTNVQYFSTLSERLQCRLLFKLHSAHSCHVNFCRHVYHSMC